MPSPAVIRLVEDGVRGVSPTAIEAATASGASRLQMILKVQLPMARRSLLVAANQGVCSSSPWSSSAASWAPRRWALTSSRASRSTTSSAGGSRRPSGSCCLASPSTGSPRVPANGGSVRGVVGRLGVGLNSNRVTAGSPMRGLRGRRRRAHVNLEGADPDGWRSWARPSRSPSLPVPAGAPPHPVPRPPRRPLAPAATTAAARRPAPTTAGASTALDREYRGQPVGRLRGRQPWSATSWSTASAARS